MKSNLVKSIVALLAVAGAGTANAAISTGQFGGDGELFLTVWDPTVGNEASFTIGLNITQSTFNSNGTYSFTNLFNDPVFLQYFGPSSAGGTNLSNQSAWQWNIVAAKDLGDESSVLFTSQGLVGTAIPNAGADNAATATTNFQLALGTCDSCGTDNALSPKNAGAFWGQDFNGALQLVDNAAGIGTSLEFYRMTNTNSFEATDPSTVVKQNFQWTLASNGTLTYGPAVPLPAAAWLLGSGLLGLVGVGRRRAAKAA